MSEYRPKRFSVLRLIAKLLRGIASLLNVWPLILIAAFVISPIGPHMRWSYRYTEYGMGQRYYTSCEYLGAKGFVYYTRGGDCPFITIIDRR